MRDRSKFNRARMMAVPLIAAVLSVGSVGGMYGTEPREAAADKAANIREVLLPIEGMSCVSCVARVKNELAGMPGVIAVTVDLVERNARIAFDASRVTTKELAAAVDKLGYKAGEAKEPPKRK